MKTELFIFGSMPWMFEMEGWLPLESMSILVAFALKDSE